MALLRVDFQEGFVGDTVVVRLDGEEAFRKSGLKTRMQIGLADSFERDVPNKNVKIEIELPEKGVREHVEVNASHPVYLGVSIENGKIIHRVSEAAFGYV